MLEKMLKKKRPKTLEEFWAYQQKAQACQNKISVEIRMLHCARMFAP